VYCFGAALHGGRTERVLSDDFLLDGLMFLFILYCKYDICCLMISNRLFSKFTVFDSCWTIFLFSYGLTMLVFWVKLGFLKKAQLDGF